MRELQVKRAWEAMVASGDNKPFRIQRSGELGGRRVDIGDGSAQVEAIAEALMEDEGLRQQFGVGWTLRFSKKLTANPIPAVEICAEQPYNVVSLGDRSREILRRQGEARLLFDVRAFKDDYEWMVRDEVAIADRLRQYQMPGKRTYGVVAASYLGPESRKICRDAGIGFIDLAGNCRLVFDQVFIERLGAPNPVVERRPLRSIFTPKASRILRVLLEAPKAPWKVQNLAREAGVSLGLAAKVKQRLLDLEFAREGKDGLLLVGAQELIRQWGAVYSYLRNSTLDCYGAGDVPKLERQLSEYCREVNVRYALAFFSGAARVAPFARYTRGFAYVQKDPASVAKDLGWKPVPSGANFTLLAPFDDGLWYGAREVNGESVVSDVQLYLDLANYKGRGEEAAQAILEQRLRPRW